MHRMKQIVFFMLRILGIEKAVFKQYYTSEDYVYITFFEDIGSAVFPLNYLNELKEKNANRKIAAVTCEKYGGLCKLWPKIDDSIIVSPKKILLIKDYLAHKDSHWKRSHNIYHFYSNREFQSALTWAHNNDQLFNKVTIYNVAYSFVYGLPVITTPCYGDYRLADIGLVQTLINKFHIEKSRSCILIPYTKSGDEIPLMFWETIVSTLCDEGYKVYTNTDDDEKVIARTEKIFAPLETVPYLVNYAGYAITNQTGLGDLLHLCNCPCSMILNYGEKYFNMSQESVKSDADLYERLDMLSVVEKNRYNMSLVGEDAFVFPNSYYGIYDSESKLKSLAEKVLRDVRENLKS